MAGPGPFDAALDRLERLIAGGEAASDAAVAGLNALDDNRPLDITAVQLRRLLAACYRLAGMDGAPVVILSEGDDPYGPQRIGWIVGELLEGTFHQSRARDRDYLANSHARVLALGWNREDHLPNGDPVPPPHIPLHRDEAAVLVGPFLAHLEGRMAEDSLAHLKLCWDIAQYPQPPFDGVFRDWLSGVDAGGRGAGADLEALDLARAMYRLHDEGRQRVGWRECEDILIPRLEHPHPLVATHAAQFLGSLYSEISDRVRGGPPWPLPRMLRHIAGLDVNRRPVAGGFVNGFDIEMNGPIRALRCHREVLEEGFDVEGWVLDVLSDAAGDDPYLPGSQMFWFPLHEEYCNKPDMALRLVEAGHGGIAWMCVTEIRPPAKGMDAVLRRMVEMGGDLAEPAERLLGEIAKPDRWS